MASWGDTTRNRTRPVNRYVVRAVVGLFWLAAAGLAVLIVTALIRGSA